MTAFFLLLSSFHPLDGRANFAPAMTSVAVAIKGNVGGHNGGKGSRRALRWAAESLIPKANRVILVHVMPRITSIPTPCMYFRRILVPSFIAWYFVLFMKISIWASLQLEIVYQ